MGYEYDRSRYFEIPGSFYFSAGNSTAGSLNTFNYRVDPKDGKLCASVWYGLKCSELSEMQAQSEFEPDDDGCREMVYWIDEQLDVYKKKLAAGEVEGKRTFSGEL